MAKYECTTCGVITEGEQHLCQSQEVKKEVHCGADTTKLKKMCTDMAEQAAYRCGFCGRRTDNPHLLCNAEKISETESS